MAPLRQYLSPLLIAVNEPAGYQRRATRGQPHFHPAEQLPELAAVHRRDFVGETRTAVRSYLEDHGRAGAQSESTASL
jgi:hypothetical protein